MLEIALKHTHEENLHEPCTTHEYDENWVDLHETNLTTVLLNKFVTKRFIDKLSKA